MKHAMIFLFDTNVVVKMLYGKHISRVLRSFWNEDIVLVFHAEILEEYVRVLRRLKEFVDPERAEAFLVLLQERGIEVTTLGNSPKLPHADDEIFVRVANSAELAGTKVVLVTDNTKHFLGITKPKVWTFAECMKKLT